jgi:hypothetical protein
VAKWQSLPATPLLCRFATLLFCIKKRGSKAASGGSCLLLASLWQQRSKPGPLTRRGFVRKSKKEKAKQGLVAHDVGMITPCFCTVKINPAAFGIMASGQKWFNWFFWAA